MRQLQNLIGAALAGAAAVIIILAVMFPLSALFHIDYAPTLATNAIIEYTPPDNAIALQGALGPLAFPFALMGGVMLIGMLGLIVGAAYAVLCGFSTPLAIGIASALMLLLVLLAFADHMTLLALAPLSITGPLLWLLTRRDPAIPIVAKRISRQTVLRRAGVFIFGGIALSVIDGLPVYQAALNATSAGRRLFDYSPPPARAAGFPAPNGPPEVTEVSKFYEMRKTPTVAPPAAPNWKLMIDGLVAHPLALSFEDILAFPRVDVYLTRECISNPVGGNLISTALFSGARLADLLQGTAGSGATQLVFYGRDGYSESAPIADAFQHGLLAYAMNGVFLPEAHGAPLKVEMPGLYGFKSMKWLSRIEVVAAPYRSIWAQEGWTETATCKTMSRIAGVSATDHGAAITGIAYAGRRGIHQVEVQINGGQWQAAALNTPPLSGQVWVQWRLDTELRGSLTISVRAVDGDGVPQIETKQSQFPDGASGLHTMTATAQTR